MTQPMRDWLAKYQAAKGGVDPETHAMIQAMKDQLLIVLVERLGNEVLVPVREIDATSGALLHMEVEAGLFTFRVSRGRK